MRSSFPTRTGFGLAIGLMVAGPVAAQGQESHLAIVGGMWFGDQFAQREITIQDPFVGLMDVGSAIDEGDATVIGVQYTGFLKSWFAAEVTVAHVSNTWTTRGGAVSGGIVTGQIVDVGGVSTVPIAVNALVRLPVLGGALGPFVTGGLGGVYYEVSRANAPLRVTAVSGAPLDTLLFDLKMGFRPAVNGGGGVMYRLGRLGLRGEGRLFRTFIEEQLDDQIVSHTNYWLALSAGLIF